MSREIELNLGNILRLYSGAMDIVADAAKRGMHDALDEWRIESTDIAPIDKGTLRRGFGPNRITGSGLDLDGEFNVTAIESTRGAQRFNYAYYIHEKNAGGRSLRASGTEKKFLDIPAEQHGEKWLRGVEAEIQSELRRRGW